MACIHNLLPFQTTHGQSDPLHKIRKEKEKNLLKTMNMLVRQAYQGRLTSIDRYYCDIFVLHCS